VFFKLSQIFETKEELLGNYDLLDRIMHQVLDTVSECSISKETKSLGALSLCLYNLLSYRHSVLLNEK
jgi:hypothetical protein